LHFVTLFFITQFPSVSLKAAVNFNFFKHYHRFQNTTNIKFRYKVYSKQNCIGDRQSDKVIDYECAENLAKLFRMNSII